MAGPATFPAPVCERARDASVVWEQSGPELEILLAAGEGGQYLECKREVPGPKDEDRRKVLKTIAAFAPKDGGTVPFGVQDNPQITGLPEPRASTSRR